MGFHADDEFLPQPSGGFGAGVTGYSAAVSAAALHTAGEHGTISGGAAADGTHRRLSSAAAIQHQHHGQDRTAARGPAALLQGGSTCGQRRTTDTAQARLLYNSNLIP